MTWNFHSLRVADTHSLIGGEAKTVIFEVPSRLKETFAWRPGQHVTLRFTLAGEEVRRSYSISSSPFTADPMRITVKRVKRGLVSNHINDHAHAGQTIEIMPPFGSFCLDPGEALRRTHYFFGAGSGITPLNSMLCTVLAAEPHSYAHLVYGNKSAKTIIFRDELAQLAKAHPDRLSVHHVLSSPSIWSSFAPWRKGTIDRAVVEATINENPPYAQNAQYYICGPGGMNQDVKTALMGLDVPAGRIHMESYRGAIDADDTVEGIDATADVVLGGQSYRVPIAAGQTLLGAMRAANLDPPFSCQSGVCGACRARLKEGDVHMRASMALEDREIKNGAILTCQAIATSTNISVGFD